MNPELERIYERIRQDTLELMKEIVAEYQPKCAKDLAASIAFPATATEIEEWRQRRLIFSVPYDGKDLYPDFLFADGAPKEVVAKVLNVLQNTAPEFGPEVPYADWDVLCWFVSSNGWLDGELPVKVMDSDPANVVKAASYARTQSD